MLLGPSSASQPEHRVPKNHRHLARGRPVAVGARIFSMSWARSNCSAVMRCASAAALSSACRAEKATGEAGEGDRKKEMT